MTEKPKVGVGIIVIKDDKILFHKRKGAHGAGTWSMPGGHLLYGESLEDCAKREVAEEADITVKNIRPGPYTNDVFEQEGKHYLTLFIIADYESGEPKVMEPDKCEYWQWFAWNNLPEPLFLPIQNIIKKGFAPVFYK